MELLPLGRADPNRVPTEVDDLLAIEEVATPVSVSISGTSRS